MRNLLASLAAALALIAAVTTARAWRDAGHMQIAAAAYRSLTPQAKERVDALRLKPDCEMDSRRAR